MTDEHGPDQGRRPPRAVSVSRVIAADRQELFDVVADPAMHPVIDGSGSVRATRGEDVARLAHGVSFGMRMRRGLAYPITNHVVEFVEGERIAWRHFHGHRWRYVFADVDAGTEVTETFDWSTSRFPLGIELMGFPAKNLAGMRETLARLEDLVVHGVVRR